MFIVLGLQGIILYFNHDSRAGKQSFLIEYFFQTSHSYSVKAILVYFRLKPFFIEWMYFNLFRGYQFKVSSNLKEIFDIREMI